MRFSSLVTFIWNLNNAGELVLLFLLFKNRIQAHYLSFTSYIAFLLVKSTILRMVSSDPELYRTLYYALGSVAGTLQLFVAFEIIRFIFAPYWTLPRYIVPRFRQAFVVMAALCLAVTYLQFGDRNTPLLLLQNLDKFGGLVTIGLLLLTSGFSVWLRIPATTHVYGIAIGMITVGSLQSILSLVFVQFSRDLRLFQVLHLLSFTVTIGVWIWFLRLAEPVMSAVSRDQSVVMLQRESRVLQEVGGLLSGAELEREC